MGRLFYQQPSGVGRGIVHVIAQGFQMDRLRALRLDVVVDPCEGTTGGQRHQAERNEAECDVEPGEPNARWGPRQTLFSVGCDYRFDAGRAPAANLPRVTEIKPWPRPPVVACGT